MSHFFKSLSFMSKDLESRKKCFQSHIKNAFIYIFREILAPGGHA